MSESNDERPTKRQRTRSPPPIASTSSLPRTEGLDAHLSRNASNDNNNNVGPATTTQAGASVAEEDEPEMTQAELDEKWRIYEMISEEYHDIVTELPLDYHRTFMLLKELDDEQQNHASTLKKNITTYLEERIPFTSDYSKKSKHFDEIHKNYLSTTRACEDKINLALTLYESVDRHIQRLDTDLALYEDSLLIGLRKGTLPSNDAPSKLHNTQNQGGGASSSGGKGGDSNEREDEFVQKEHEKEWSKIQGLVKKEQQQKEKSQKKKKGGGTATLQELGGAAGAGVIGMPIDPNEPLYCFCRRVSFGEMVACENEDCPTEWFHLECLGMEKAPAGEWYCDECSKKQPAATGGADPTSTLTSDLNSSSSSPAKETNDGGGGGRRSNLEEDSKMKEKRKRERKEKRDKKSAGSSGEKPKERKRKRKSDADVGGGPLEKEKGKGGEAPEGDQSKKKEKRAKEETSSSSAKPSSTDKKGGEKDSGKPEKVKKKMGRPPKDKSNNADTKDEK